MDAMDGNVLYQMGMQPLPNLTSKKLQQFYFCKDFNASSHYHIHGTDDGRMSMGLMIVMLILGFFAFFVNLGVIIRTVKILRHGHDNKPAFYFIGNLALGDLAIGLYIIVAFLLHLTNRSDLWQQKSCTLQLAVAITACQETIFTIMLIAVDKYLYICHALKYHDIVTMTRVYIAVISSWVISIIIGSLPAMGMLEKWEDTCGRCIFAQVVTKQFAILFFITAVVLPYAVAVSLYSILLYLAIKMQKTRYGGTYKVSQESRTSNFRLSFMTKSTKSTKSRSSSLASTVKSTSSRSTVSTSVSLASNTSATKAQRRRMRKQAMQEYKASLPGVDNRTDGSSAKLVRVRPVNRNDEFQRQLHGLCDETDSEVAVRLVKDDLNTSVNSHVRGSQQIETDGSQFESDTCSANTVRCDVENAIEGKNTESGSNNNQSSSRKEITHMQSARKPFGKLHHNSVVSVHNENGHGSAKTVDKSITCEDPSGHDNDAPNPIIEEGQSHLKNTVRKQYSESSRSSRSLPSLTSTDLDEESDSDDARPRWSLSAYFNRVVSDTKDKVLFLKKCQAVKTVFLIIGSFSITYVPFVVGSLVYRLEIQKSKTLLHALQTILFCAIVANSLVNPLLYAYGYREFRIRTERFKGVFAREKRPKL